MCLQIYLCVFDVAESSTLKLYSCIAWLIFFNLIFYAQICILSNLSDFFFQISDRFVIPTLHDQQINMIFFRMHQSISVLVLGFTKFFSLLRWLYMDTVWWRSDSWILHYKDLYWHVIYMRLERFPDHMRNCFDINNILAYSQSNFAIKNASFFGYFFEVRFR